MKTLICSFYFPPSGGGGVQRSLKFAQRLPEFGIETRVVAPTDSRWIHHDEPTTGLPPGHVYRVPFLGPRGRLPAEELYGTSGFERLRRRVLLQPRRMLIPDENVSWALTAVPAIVRIVRREGIDVLLTTSPPNSVHLIGAAVKRLTGVTWLADVRDSIAANPDRRIESAAVRLKERTLGLVVRTVALNADAIVAVTDQIAAELTARSARAPVEVIANGADFDDVPDLHYRAGPRLRITHTGSFFGKRDPRPFLTALAGVDADVVARFVGDFRRADLDWVHARGLETKLELIPFAPRRRSLELQRESDVLLLLLPEVGDRGRDIPSGKLYEYLAARRPILAAVPPSGTAAELIHAAGAGTVVAPDDVEGLRQALTVLAKRWRQGNLPDIVMSPQIEQRISRTERVRELAELLRRLAGEGKGVATFRHRDRAPTASITTNDPKPP
jgi:glycosyltransferase involved in cell wall biosynthesis